MSANSISADNAGPMLNLYPDSIGGNMAEVVSFLERKELPDVFSSLYVLPSLYNSDLDRGFSVIDYGLNDCYATTDDLIALREAGINLKLDFILNHASVLSPQFQDLLKNGVDSEYRDFFIDWNKFWYGYGSMTPQGYIQPDSEYIEHMFFRKQGLPILMVRMPNGQKAPYWNTFYQEIRYPHPDAQDILKLTDLQYLAAKRLSQLVCDELDAGKMPSEIAYGERRTYSDCIAEWLESGCKYLGQMDMNIKSPKVWDYYKETLKTLSGYGASIVRLDAFAYASKIPGARNFFNEPDTWDILDKLKVIASHHGIELLPEIHSSYSEKLHERLTEKGYITYDFFLPGLILDALERHDGALLARWATEIKDKDFMLVNMLGCHDGIPLLDLKGLLPDDQIESLIEIVVRRGGFVKELHGQKNVYYQVNATYYSALGEDDRKMLLARAIQLFMPGKPQVWYLDLFAGTNDYEAVKAAGKDGHKEINRTNIRANEIDELMRKSIVRNQISLIKFRNTYPAFGFDSDMQVNVSDIGIQIAWEKSGHKAILRANLVTYDFSITAKESSATMIYDSEYLEWRCIST